MRKKYYRASLVLGLLVRFSSTETRKRIHRDEHARSKQRKGRKKKDPKKGANGFFARVTLFFFSSSTSSSSSTSTSTTTTTPKTPPRLTHNSGRCQYVPILGLIGVLLCLAGLAIYAGGAVPAGRTIAALVSKVDTKTAAASSSSSGGGEESSASRLMGGGPLSRLVGAYIATTAVSSAHFLVDFFPRRR